PAAPLPVVDPLGNSLLHVLGIRVDAHPGALLERQQALDDSHEFHAVVGRLRLSAEHFLLPAAVAQEHAPAAGAGIALAGTVGIDLDDGPSAVRHRYFGGANCGSDGHCAAVRWPAHACAHAPA